MYATNRNPTSQIPYGVIAVNSLDPDIQDILWYGPQAKDLSYTQALAELRAEVTREADEAESTYADISDPEDRQACIEDAYAKCGFTDREDFINRTVENRSERIQIEEPIIEGEYQSVQYRITWLQGPILFVFQSPYLARVRPASICVPGAGDLNSLDPDSDFLCYDVPPEWREK